MKKKNGKIQRVRLTVSQNFSPAPANPGAIRRVRTGVKTMPAAVITRSAQQSVVKRELRNFWDSSLESALRDFVKTGTKEEERAPSPRSRRKRFEVRNAV